VPPPVSGYLAWYDASDSASITHSGGAVSQWNDLSGNGYHLTQDTDVNKPTTGTRTINGRNAIDFVEAGANSDVLNSTAFPITAQPFTICAVVLCDSVPGTTNRYFDGFDGTLGRALFYVNAGTWRVNAGTAVNTTKAPVTGTAVRHSVVFNGASSAFYENGTQHGGTLNPGTGGIYDIDIGGARDNATDLVTNINWDGLVAEWILYPSALSTADRQSVEDYLKTKWQTRVLAGTSPAAASSSGSSSVTRATAGSVSAASSASGSLSITRTLAGTVPAAASASATTISNIIQLVGSITAAASAGASVGVGRSVAGTVTAAASASSSAFTRTVRLTGSAPAAAGASAALSATRPLAGTLPAAASATGALSTERVCETFPGILLSDIGAIDVRAPDVELDPEVCPA
jgi:hypothetical protein